MNKNKFAIYQVFTRLFGNTHQANIPWGTKQQNGLGKFSDFTDLALKQIKDLGMTHIWYTGVPHHALIGDYSEIGVAGDHPVVVKGRAGSPYAVKDYYSVNPDLADDPAQRMEEFEALIQRSHQNGLKVIIDIVPNHVARQYQGLNNPAGVVDFGSQDATSVEYHKHNNFYYIPDQAFEAPDIPEQFQPLGNKQLTSLIDQYFEFPAKWTGNGARSAKPDFDDWYETAKINYGVRPDGTKDFPSLPDDYHNKTHAQHLEFWQQHALPNSWYKFRDIALFWIDKGVDGFRYDMAEMVPVEFWSFMNSSIKARHPDAFLMAEVYQPNLYRDYIHLGKMDYLYDKVDLYDGLKAIIQGHASTRLINDVRHQYEDIEHHLLQFLDNHDEQRVASPQFAGYPEKAKPAMLISTLLRSSPTMIYFGQEVGEPGAENAGFGQPSRTSIFDYIGVPHHQRWMNDGKFDGGQLTSEEKSLRRFYQNLMQFSLNHSAIMGEFDDIYANNESALGRHGYVFGRHDAKTFVLVAANFNASEALEATIHLSSAITDAWGLADGEHSLIEHIENGVSITVKVDNGVGVVSLHLPPLASYAFTL